MKQHLTLTALLALAVIAAPAWSQGEVSKLELGDLAPPLDVEFVRGEAVNLADGIGSHAYVVEFWATWCGPCRTSIPHLSSLQKRYEEQGLVVIGISDEDKETVVPYMEKMGDKMDYRIALDSTHETIINYFSPFSIEGIPTAFVIDKQGKLIWYGHPLDPDLERVVAFALEDERGAQGSAEKKAAPRRKVAEPARNSGSSSKR